MPHQGRSGPSNSARKLSQSASAANKPTGHNPVARKGAAGPAAIDVGSPAAGSAAGGWRHVRSNSRSRCHATPQIVQAMSDCATSRV